MRKPMINAPTAVLAFSLALAGACGAPGDDGVAAGPDPVGQIQQAYRDKQGPARGTAMSLYPNDTLRLNNGSLSLLLGGAWVEGAALAGASFAAYDFDGRLQILSIASAVAAGPNEYHYKISVTSLAGVKSPLCAGDVPASAIPGFFTPTSYYQNTGLITLSCDGGVVNKCLKWGYKPWVNTASGLFMSCVRMAMADYCGTNQANTISGTTIDLYDWGLVNPINQRTQPNLALEGIYADPNWQGPVAVLCLAKRRWDALPPLGPCDVGALRDPRLPTYVNNAQVPPDPTLFCENRSLDQWQAEARSRYGVSSLALMVNDSNYTDAGLTRWRYPTGPSLTSGRFDLNGAGILGQGSALPSGTSYGCFEGRLFSRTITGEQAAALGTIVPLYTFNRTTLIKLTRVTQLWTTTQSAVAGYGAKPTLEGYVYPPAAPAPAGTLPLYSYSSGRYGYTTTTQLPLPTPAGLRLEGYILPPIAGATSGCVARP